MPDGSFATFRAKAYPEKLCELLATHLVSSLESTAAVFPAASEAEMVCEVATACEAARANYVPLDPYFDHVIGGDWSRA